MSDALKNLIYIDPILIEEYKNKYLGVEEMLAVKIKNDETLFVVLRDIYQSYIDNNGIFYLNEKDFPYVFLLFKELIEDIQNGKGLNNCLQKLIKSLIGDVNA